MADAADKSTTEIRAALAAGDCERAWRLTQELRATDPRGADAVAGEVNAALDDRDFRRASEEASLTGIIRYLMKHPDGRRRAEAEQMLARLEGADDAPAPKPSPELAAVRLAAVQPPSADEDAAQPDDALGDLDFDSARQIAADLERDGNPDGAAAELDAYLRMRPQGRHNTEAVREIERLRPASAGERPAEKPKETEPSNEVKAVAANAGPVHQAAEPSAVPPPAPQPPAGADERDRLPAGVHEVAVVGDSMLPLATHGQRLLCSSDEPKEGDLAVIELEDGELLFKRVRFETGRVLCLSVNPDPQFMPFTIAKNQIRRMRKIWGLRF